MDIMLVMNTDKTIIKLAKNIEEAKRIAVQLTRIYSIPFYIEQKCDLWRLNYDH